MAFSLFQPYTNLPVKPKSLACVHLSLCGIRGFESAFIIVCLVFVVLKVHLSLFVWYSWFWKCIYLQQCGLKSSYIHSGQRGILYTLVRMWIENQYFFSLKF